MMEQTFPSWTAFTCWEKVAVLHVCYPHPPSAFSPYLKRHQAQKLIHRSSS